MSVKQPKRNDEKEPEQSQPSEKTEDNKQTSETIDDWLDNFDPSTNKQQSQQQTRSGQKTETPEEEDPEVNQEQAPLLNNLLAEFTKRLPTWINKPWMYVQPTHEGHLKNWYVSWKDLILKYTETLTKHIVNIYDLKEVHPFTHQSSGKELSPEQLQFIIDKMVKDNLAKWLDADNVRARIYYMSNEEWAELIHQYTLDHGYALDVMTFYELQNLNEDWSTLPDGELKEVLQILVEQDKAEWVGEDRDAIQFKVN